MIKDIISKNFTAFSGKDKVKDLFKLIAEDEEIRYIVIAFTNKKFSVIKTAGAKEIIRKFGEKIGRRVLELSFASIPEFIRICDFVNIDESESVARSRAIKCPEKLIVVLEDNKPVGVIKEEVRGITATLYGDRYDIFEQGTVKPKYQFSCQECNSEFDFYEPKIEGRKILYCCPQCKQIIEQ